MKPGTQRIELGRHIVADPEVCHGQPTFKDTRIMVPQVLDDVAEGRSWDTPVMSAGGAGFRWPRWPRP